MKKFIYLLLGIVLAVSIYFIYPKLNPTTQISNLNITTTEENLTETTHSPSTQLIETTTENPQETSLEETSMADSLFGEEFINSSQYPLATVPDALTGLSEELYGAINTIYQETYTQEQKDANTVALTTTDLSDLEAAFEDNDVLSPLNIVVDQVSMTLDAHTVFVPRIIVPITFQDAERIIENSDVQILTEAMTFLGNRLVMIAYYNPQTEQLITYHLTNWTSPLYSHPQE